VQHGVAELSLGVLLCWWSSEAVEDVSLGWVKADLVILVLELLVDGLLVPHRRSAHAYLFGK
jgi:hypothetical protein